ncbi:putative bacteriocin precursor [Anaerobacterium chartisolvens]|uniref:Putative bacteriocin n=1 Tax=Anaerobacterium chartisolvens TaxID=1297424 RepID=A0A369B4L6_9FIRM|nr:CLI_3235 family bacteriocin precursor [Anaerobacterium chartisolvens]RCX15466.1 putative bacteriocin precursor [Anaerobacterium chartisolvens]
MKKLGKKLHTTYETIEAFAECVCACNLCSILIKNTTRFNNRNFRD